MSTGTSVQQKTQGFKLSPLNAGKTRTEKKTPVMPFEEALNRAADFRKDQDYGQKRQKQGAAAKNANEAAERNAVYKSEQDSEAGKETIGGSQVREDSRVREDSENTAKSPEPKKDGTEDNTGIAVNLQAMMAMTETVQVLQPEKVNEALGQQADQEAAALTDGVSPADQPLIQAQPEQPGENTKAQMALAADAGQTAVKEEAMTSFRPVWQNGHKGIDSLSEGGPDSMKTGFADNKAIAAVTPEESGTADSKSETESGFADMMRTQANLAKAAKAAGSGEETAEETVDLENLKKNAEEKGLNLMDRLAQARINGGSGVHTAGKAREAAPAPVLTQLKTGLEQGIKENLQEFTIKLKPEGLGEIVVHMASAGGKLTVDIGATSQETQKLINSQMAALKEMLEPLHAEVGSVSHSSQNAMEFMNFSQNQFQNQSRQAFGARGAHGTHRIGGDSEDEFADHADRMIAESIPGRLYAYV